MIARKLGLSLIVGCIALYGCDMMGGEEGGGEEGETPAVEGTEGEGGEGAEGEGEGEGEGGEGAGEGEGEGGEEAAGPDAACTALIEAVKSDDDEAIKAASTEAIAPMLEVSEAKKAVAEVMAEATCGEVKEGEDGATATVPVTAGENTREIPFAKVDGEWKFDAAKYVEMYPPEDKAKGKAKKKGKRRKGKRKKK